MASKIIKILRGVALVALLSISILSHTDAQCPMCKMTVESNMKNGGTMGNGFNAGILYLLLTPYLLVGGIAYVWWKNKKRRDDIEIEEELATIV